MNSKEYEFWIDKINQDATEASEEMSVAFPSLSKEQYFNAWIRTHTQALNYLIANHKEVNAYSIASTSSDIINRRIII